MEGRLTITEVAKAIGVTPRTLMRWEKAGRIKKSKRDWRGWRFYQKEDLVEIKKFYESTYDYDSFEGMTAANLKNIIAIFALSGLFLSCILCVPAAAQSGLREVPGIRETTKAVDIVLDKLPAVRCPQDGAITESVKYTLGPNDVVAIEVRRHPEFSGEYTVNSEGKIEYKYVGDVIVDGLTKMQLKERLDTILSEYIISPEIDVRIVAYLSKVFYVVGDVHRPGKFYMKGNEISIREALVQAGLPTNAAAMRKCRLITPNAVGKKNNYLMVNVYELLYGGDLKENIDMRPGDVLYVPATIMAKVIRVIAPVTDAVGQVTGTAAKGAALAATAL